MKLQTLDLHLGLTIYSTHILNICLTSHELIPNKKHARRPQKDNVQNTTTAIPRGSSAAVAGGASNGSAAQTNHSSPAYFKIAVHDEIGRCAYYASGASTRRPDAASVG